MVTRTHARLLTAAVIALALPVVTLGQAYEPPRVEASSRIQTQEPQTVTPYDEDQFDFDDEARSVLGNVDDRSLNASGRVAIISGTLVDLQQHMTSDSQGTVLGNVDDFGAAAPQTTGVSQIFALDSPQGLIILGKQSMSKQLDTRPASLRPVDVNVDDVDIAVDELDEDYNEEELGAIPLNDLGAQTATLGVASPNLAEHLGHQVSISGNLFEKQGVKFMLVNSLTMQSVADDISPGIDEDEPEHLDLGDIEP